MACFNKNSEIFCCVFIAFLSFPPYDKLVGKNLECLPDDAKIFEKTGDFALISDVLRTTA